MNVKININSAAVKARMTEKTHDAMKLLMSNFLKDCNDYAPQDQSVLINSSIIHTGISADWIPPLGKKVTSEQLQALARAKGSEVEIRNDSIAMVLRWETPYARTLYYGVSKKGNPISYSYDENPKACKMWAHKAAATKGEQWRRQLQKLLTGSDK